ncbi:MAG: DNA internalization-related competence protein ComEC/Rec2 [Myxococcota bacterium]
MVFAAGVGLGDRVAPSALPALALPALGLAAALLGGALFGLRRRGAGVGLVALAAGFFVLGAAALAGRLEMARRRAPDACGCQAVVDARVAGVARLGAGPGAGVRVELAGVAPASAAREACVPRRVELRAWGGDPEFARVAALVAGERIRAHLRLEAVRGRANPGARDAAAAARRRGVGARARLVAPGLLHRRDLAAARGRGGPTRARARTLSRLRSEGRGGALLAALALGEGRGVADADRRAAARLGIAHLLAVSGLHVALVIGGVYALARRLLVRAGDWAHARDVRAFAWAVALSAAAAYAWLAGGRPPVVRAWVLAALAVGGLWVGRRRGAAEALAVAALAVLAWEPATLFELGPQLSFAAAGALLTARPPRAWPARPWLAGALRDSLSTTALAVIATAPILAAHGLAASPWALAANGLAVPWCAFVLMPLAFAATSAAWVASLGAGAPGLADRFVEACAQVARLHLDALVRLADWLAADPSTPVPGATPLWALAVAAALAACSARSASVRLRLVACAGALGVIAWAEPPAIAPAPPRVVALDVGQGDAVLVQGTRGTLLVDAGGAVPGRWDAGESVVVPALGALGVEGIDVLVLTHADLDHRGGAAAVLDALPVDELWLPSGFDAALRERLARRARSRGTRLRSVSAGDPRVRVGDLDVEVLWPRVGPSGPRNERSLVLRVGVGERSVLLTGDAGRASERALLAAGRPLAADVLKVGHHGSAGGSDTAFLAAVRPALALVSAPYPGRRGLPSPPVLARLEAAGAEVLWTGRDGALLVELSDELEVRTWRVAEAPPAPAVVCGGISPPFGGEATSARSRGRAGATCDGRCPARSRRPRDRRRRPARAARRE